MYNQDNIQLFTGKKIYQNKPQIAYELFKLHQIFSQSSMMLENKNECINRYYFQLFTGKKSMKINPKLPCTQIRRFSEK